MADFTDFKNGLQDANEYLDTRHHLSGTTALGNSNLRAVAQAEYSFTLRELLCGVLGGNGIKLPNIQICMSANINALLNIPGLQAELYDALTQLDGAMNDFMDHTKLDNVLGRLNGVLAEAQNVANMINFCSTPVDPIAIPNMLERAMGSFLGAGKTLIDQIGSIVPGQVCACLGTGGFNGNVFNGGILGTIANNIDAINAGSLGQSVLDSIRQDITSVTEGISNLISFENNINGAYALGGSQFATPDPNCHSGIGVLHNPQNGSIASNARLASSMKGLYDKLAGYPVTYRPGTSLGGSNGTTPVSGSNLTPEQSEPIEYENIFKLLFDDDFLTLLDQADDPQSNVDNQIPVYDYCGTIIGYTTQVIQREDDKSLGSDPTAPNSPGYLAGGLNTSDGNQATNTETVSEGTITINNAGGATVYLVSSEQAQLALQTNTHDLVVRTDILTIFTRLDTSLYNFGTMLDYQQSSVTFTAFGKNVNELTGAGFVAKDGTVAVARSIEGTTNQITVFNANGAGGNPRVAIADNPQLPGSGSVRIPSGNSAERTAPALGGMVRYNNATNEIEAYYADINAWREVATIDDVTSQSNVFVNIGTGAEVYKQKNANDEQEFRRINALGALVVTQNPDAITISDSITMSNQASGVQVFKQRTGNDFEFRTLKSTGGGVTIDQATNDIDINTPGVARTTLTTTTDTSTAVTFGGSELHPAQDKSWFFKIYVLAGRGTTKRAWQLQGVVQDNSNTDSFVGAVGRIDYQRNTGEASVNPWSAGSAYSTGIQVEHDMVIYESNTNISGGSTSSYTSPDTNSDWTVIDAGWNASVIINSGNMSIRVRGDSGTVNWSVKLEYVEL